MGQGWGTPRAAARAAAEPIRFADPYKRCTACKEWVDGAEVGTAKLTLIPCGHLSDYEDLCPSWSPVTGCGCKAFSESHPDNPITHDMRPPTPGDGKVY